MNSKALRESSVVVAFLSKLGKYTEYLIKVLLVEALTTHSYFSRTPFNT